MAAKLPPFKTEWWAKNQGLIANRFEQAKAEGNLGKGTISRRLCSMRAETGAMAAKHQGAETHL